MAHHDEGTRHRILEAAGAVFAENGYEKSTIREICARAEVNLAAVNYHFGDKERLYRETIRHAHHLATEQVPLPKWDAATTPQRRLRDFVETMMRRLLTTCRLPWQAQLLMREFTQPCGASRETVEEFIRPQHQLLCGILAEFLPPGTPDWKLDQFAFSVVGQCLFYKVNNSVVSVLVSESQRSAHFSPEQLADHIVAFVLSALANGPSGMPESVDPEILGRADAVAEGSQ